MGWSYPIEVARLVSRANDLGAGYLDGVGVRADMRDDEKLNAFVWEVSKGWFPCMADGKTFNGGVDIGLPLVGDIAGLFDTPVKAIADGVVAVVEDGIAVGSGLAGYDFDRVIIRHTSDAGEVYALYQHLDHVRVHEGQEVKEGEVIGTIGTYASFPHLHFAVAAQSPIGGDKDLFPEAAKDALPAGDQLWDVLRIKVPALDDSKWAGMPAGEWYLFHPIEFVRYCRGEEYRHYIGRGSSHSIEATQAPVKQPIQSGETQVDVHDVLQSDALKGCAGLQKMAADHAAPPIKRGDPDEGGVVTAIQTVLVACKYGVGRKGPDGDFGKTTERAIKQFQTKELKQLLKDTPWLSTFADSAPSDGQVDRLTLLMLDKAAMALKTAPPEPPQPAPPAPAPGKQPDAGPPLQPPSGAIVFDADGKKLSMAFGLRLYRAYLEWELSPRDKPTQGCFYSANCDGSSKAYRKAYDEALKSVPDADRWNGDAPGYAEWPDLSKFGLPEGHKAGDFTAYTMYGRPWAATGFSNCCNSQLAAFFVAFGGFAFGVKTGGATRTYWSSTEGEGKKDATFSLKLKKKKKEVVTTKRATTVMGDCINAVFPEAVYDTDGNLVSDFPNRGGTVSALLSLALGGPVGGGNGHYTTDQAIWKQARIADFANTPGHTFILGDLQYGIWFEGSDTDGAPDRAVYQSSFADDPAASPAYAFSGVKSVKFARGDEKVPLLTRGQIDWLAANEATFEERIAAFLKLEGGSGLADAPGKKIAKIAVTDFQTFSSNAVWSDPYTPEKGKKKGILQPGTHTIHGEMYSDTTDQSTAAPAKTKSNPLYRGVTRHWNSGIPTKGVGTGPGGVSLGRAYSFSMTKG